MILQLLFLTHMAGNCGSKMHRNLMLLILPWSYFNDCVEHLPHYISITADNSKTFSLTDSIQVV